MTYRSWFDPRSTWSWRIQAQLPDKRTVAGNGTLQTSFCPANSRGSAAGHSWDASSADKHGIFGGIWIFLGEWRQQKVRLCNILVFDSHVFIFDSSIVYIFQLGPVRFPISPSLLHNERVRWRFSWQHVPRVYQWGEGDWEEGLGVDIKAADRPFAASRVHLFQFESLWGVANRPDTVAGPDKETVPQLIHSSASGQESRGQGTSTECIRGG